MSDRDRHVYVIGAGASKGIGFPTGDELKPVISSVLNIDKDSFEWHLKDRVIDGTLRKYAQANRLKINSNLSSEILNACDFVSRNVHLDRSIDSLVDANRNNQLIADICKLAICRVILEKEGSCALNARAPDQLTPIIKSIAGSWYQIFFSILKEDCSLEDLPAQLKKVTLIIFNYDRCVEHSLVIIFNEHV